MKVLTYVVGPLETNTYVIYDEKSLEALIVDPGGDEIVDYVSNLLVDLNVKYVIATHGHLDHVLGIRALRSLCKVKFLIHRDDKDVLSMSLDWADIWGVNVTLDDVKPDDYLDEGFSVTLGGVEFKILHTPGHSPGSITIYAPSLKIAFTGDTLFKGSVGRTDLPGGSLKELKASLRRLVIELDKSTKVFPGHGPSTTLEEELTNNRYLRNVNAIT